MIDIKLYLYYVIFCYIPFYSTELYLCVVFAVNRDKEYYSAHGREEWPSVKHGYVGQSLDNWRPTKNKRVRTIFTTEQLERLEIEFKRQQYMVGIERFVLRTEFKRQQYYGLNTKCLYSRLNPIGNNIRSKKKGMYSR